MIKFAVIDKRSGKPISPRNYYFVLKQNGKLYTFDGSGKFEPAAENYQYVQISELPMSTQQQPDDRIIYSLTCPKHPGSVAIFYYDLEGRLVRVDWNPDVSMYFQKTTGQELPARMAQLEPFRRIGCAVKDISKLDLSFPKFWNHYAYKVGNKPRAQKLWEKLPREDRIMALGFVRRLRNFSQQKGIEMPYPETYLNQRRWENILP